MQDEPDPPRKVYGFKPREFERANPAAAAAPGATPPADPAAPANPDAKIDVNELIRAGAGVGRQLGSNAVANRANDVHAILSDNLKRDQAAGHYDLGPLDDSKRRRRIRNFWIIIVAVDVPLGAFAWWMGHTNPLPFVCAISAMALITARLTWDTFFLRTHY